MARIRFSVNVTSLMPSDSNVSASAGPAGASAGTQAESTGRFGYALLQVYPSTEGESPSEYLLEADAIRGSSFRFETQGEFTISEAFARAGQLTASGRVLRFKIDAHSGSLGRVIFQIMTGNETLEAVDARNVRLSATQGSFVEFMGFARANTAAIDLRRAGSGGILESFGLI